MTGLHTLFQSLSVVVTNLVLVMFQKVVYILKFILFYKEEGRGEAGRGREGDERGREDRETSICCFTYLFIHWWTLMHALTRDQTGNLGSWGNVPTN